MLFVKQMDNVCREENLWLWQHAAYLPWEHQKNKKEVRTTPSIPVSSWNFEIFFQGPGKLLEKLIISQYSWNFKETFSSVFKTNQNLQMHLTHNCTFCVLCRLGFSCCYCGRNYLMSFCFCMPRRREKLGLGPGNINSLPRRTPGKLLGPVVQKPISTNPGLNI